MKKIRLFFALLLVISATTRCSVEAQEPSLIDHYEQMYKEYPEEFTNLPDSLYEIEEELYNLPYSEYIDLLESTIEKFDWTICSHEKNVYQICPTEEATDNHWDYIKGYTGYVYVELDKYDITVRYADYVTHTKYIDFCKILHNIIAQNDYNDEPYVL